MHVQVLFMKLLACSSAATYRTMFLSQGTSIVTNSTQFQPDRSSSRIKQKLSNMAG